MGGVVESIGNAFGEVGHVIGNIEQGVVHAVEGAAKSVGHALESVGKTVTNDPIGTLAKVAAVVTQQYWALPLISAADVVAHGGSLEQAAIAGGVSYIGGEIAGGLSDALQTSSESVLTGVESGTNGSTVYNYSDGSSMIQSADGATSFTDPTGLGSNAANAIGSGAANAVKALAQTGDIGKAITSGVVSGAGGYLGSETSSALQDQGLGTTTSNILGKVAGTTAAATAAGKDPAAALASSLFNTAMGQTGSVLKSAWDGVNNVVTQYNQQLDQTKALYSEQLTPAQQATVDAQNAAKTSYDNYTNVNSQFNDLVSQYNAAKDANNVDLANSLADKANALIPQLNVATDKFNADSGTYQTALDKFNTVNDQYTKQIGTLDNLKTDYTTQNDKLAQLSQDTSAAAEKVAAMSDASQKTFTNLISSGKDPSAALDYANNVNKLSTPEQTTYSNALNSGLSVDQAYNAAPVATNMNVGAQSVYFNALQNGEDPSAAANKALVASVLYQGTDPTGSVTISSPPSVEAPTAAPTETTAAPTETTAAPTETTAAPTETTAAPTDTSSLSSNQLQMLVNGLFSGNRAATAPRIPVGISTAPTGISTAQTPDVSPLDAISSAPSVATPKTATGQKFANLVGQYSQGTPVKLANEPTFAFTPTTDPTANLPTNWQQVQQEIQAAAGGGSIQKFEDGGSVLGWTQPMLRGSFTRGTQSHFAQLPGYQEHKFAAGGDVNIPEGHNPTFFSEGGLNSLENTYVQGEGDGTSDSVAAMLANGEFVIPADVVSKLGNGSNEAGAGVLDQLLVNIREHAQSNPPDKLPPKSKSPLAYLLDSKRKVA